jgi:3-oxoacyl-[acyl-carrier-protein] synthase-3
MSDATSIQVGLLGTGCYLPERVVTNEELAERWKVTTSAADAFLGDFGVRERRVCAPGETASEMEVKAALQALQNAGVKAADVDMVLTGTLLRDRPNPSNAARVCHRMGAVNAFGFDVEAGCATLLHHLVVASAMIKQGAARIVVCTTGTTWSRVADYTSKDGWLLGDGAAALVVGPVDGRRGVLASHFKTLGEHWDSISIMACRPKGDPAKDDRLLFRVSDDPRALDWHMSTAARLVPESVRRSLERAGLRPNDLDYFVPHNPNVQLPGLWAKALGLSDRYKTTVEKYGNMAGASVGVNLHENLSAGRVRVGDLIAIAAPTAGFTFASVILRV